MARLQVSAAMWRVRCAIVCVVAGVKFCNDLIVGLCQGVRAGCFVIGVTTSQPADFLRAAGGVHATVSDFCDPRLKVWSQVQKQESDSADIRPTEESATGE